MSVTQAHSLSDWLPIEQMPDVEEHCIVDPGFYEMMMQYAPPPASPLTDDVRAARLLAAEKEVFRDIEEAATQAHFDRLCSGGVERPVDPGALALDVLRDLKQVNAHLVAAALIRC